MTTPQSASRQPRKWTVIEDQKLREEVEAQMVEGEVKDWCRIAAKLPGRTNKDCRKRWHNSVAGGLKKGQWSKSEDMQLARGVQQYGQRWTLVANSVGSRSADQCAKRWQQSLDPELDRSEWRESEDKQLIEAVQKLGRHWKDIQRQNFPGRSKNCIKNRYTVLVRRYQNQGITLPSGASTPEPGTPSRMSNYPTTDDDAMSYSSNLYDDLVSSHNHISSPGSSSTWSLAGDSFPAWTPTESFNMNPAPVVSPASELSYISSQQNTGMSNASQWDWSTATATNPSPGMHMSAFNTSRNCSNPSAFSYDPYNSVPTLLSPNSAHSQFNTSGNRTNTHGISSNRAPTSSPSSRTSTGEPYQGHNAMSAYMKTRMQTSNPPYQY